MKNRVFLILLLPITIILSSCKQTNSTKGFNKEIKEITEKKEQNITKHKSVETKSIYSKEQFIGVWAESEDGNALFEITKDSLRYVEYYDTPYYFDVKGDTLMIFLDEGFISKSRVIKIDKDSLIYKNEYSLSRLYKRAE